MGLRPPARGAASPASQPEPVFQARQSHMTGRLTIALACLTLVPVVQAQKVECPVGASHIDMTRGSYSSQPNVVFQLRNFHAALVPLGKTAPLCFEKMTVVSHAEIFVSNRALSEIFSEKLQKSDSKIKDFRVENGMTSATLSGSITHLIPIHFSVEGPVTTDGTDIRLNADKIKADGIPLKALLALVGEHLNAILKLNGVDGVKIDGNALSFSPEKVAHLKGHIAQVITSADGLTLRYATDRVPRGQQAPHVAALRSSLQK